ncbi:MAG: COX15/CtaA family protein [Candidatus Promineifilaceae bacterium]
MTEKQNKQVTIWLFVVCGLIMFMVVLGGYVRLTRSGLSMVEWEPVHGVIPPIGEAQWQEEFAKYQATPEFKIVNSQMTLDQYKGIFYVEYVHRLLARFAGLMVVIPLIYFLIKGIIPWRKSGIYLAIAILFGLQGAMGWYMVSSGLEDVPAVSHYRLTIHLLLALFLLALTMWMALNHRYGFPQRAPGARRSSPYIVSVLVLAVLILQISYGGLVAGMKAGHVSNTWPLMFGRIFPPGLLAQVEPWWKNLVEAPVTVHFIHRWLAFGVLFAALYLYWVTSKRSYSPIAHKATMLLAALTVLQITLGVSVVWFGVPIWLALAHQAVALFLFVVATFINYRVAHEPVPYPGALEPQLELKAA